MAEKKQPLTAGAPLPPAVKEAAGTNSALDADIKAQKEAGKEGYTDEYAETGSQKTSIEAIDPTKVQGVGSTLGLTVGSQVSVQLSSGRTCRANVMGVHPGTTENEAAGIQAVEPTIDAKVETGNPDKGGWEEMFGIPVSSVTSEAQYR